jgi:dTDP-4-amino-4,6-dideoxygalactose transaminase
VQAALLRVKLRFLEGDLERRRQLAGEYDEALQGTGVRLPVRAPGRTHTFHIYTVTADDRDALRDRLARFGIESAVCYHVPLHLQPALARPGHAEEDFPVAEAASREVLSLPMFPQLTSEEVRRVAAVIDSVRSGV